MNTLLVTDTPAQLLNDAVVIQRLAARIVGTSPIEAAVLFRAAARLDKASRDMEGEPITGIS